MKKFDKKQAFFALLSLICGFLASGNKHSILAQAAAPSLAAGGGAPYLFPLPLLAGLCIGAGLAGKWTRLPLYLLLAALRPLLYKNRRPLSPPLTGFLSAGYMLAASLISGAEGVDILITLCAAVLSGCILFFSRQFVEAPSLSPGTFLPIAGSALLVADSPFLYNLPLWCVGMFLILLCADRRGAGGALSAIALALSTAFIGGTPNALPVFLSAAAGVSVMGRFSRKRHTAAALICAEFALFLSGLWLEQLLYFVALALGAGLYLLLPAPPEPEPDSSYATTEADSRFRQAVEAVEQMAAKNGQKIKFFPEISERATDLLAQAGAEQIRVSCAADPAGDFFLDATFVCSRLSGQALLGLMERASGKSLTPAAYHRNGREVCASFVPRAGLRVECAALGKNKEGETVCGDSAVAFSADQKHYVMLLSDGMGSGSDAFAQSHHTVTLLQKLLRAGIRPAGALGMAHDSLRLTNEDDSFATADICQVNLETGQAEFLKAGAEASFVLRGEQILEVGGSSMPLGAPVTPDYLTHREQLLEGDILLLCSDGALSDRDKMLDTLQKYRGESPAGLAAKLVGTALAAGKAADDTTVLVAQISKNGEHYEI